MIKSSVPSGNRTRDLSIRCPMCYHLSFHHGLLVENAYQLFWSLAKDAQLRKYVKDKLATRTKYWSKIPFMVKNWGRDRVSIYEVNLKSGCNIGRMNRRLGIQLFWNKLYKSQNVTFIQVLDVNNLIKCVRKVNRSVRVSVQILAFLINYLIKIASWWIQRWFQGLIKLRVKSLASWLAAHYYLSTIKLF